MTNESVGIVLGTKDAAPLEFWVGVNDGQMLQLDDIVVMKTCRPNVARSAQPLEENCIRFYGVVDSVRKLHEGVTYDSDTRLALEGTIPVNVSYAAHVIVTRVDPEEFIPPHPGDEVFHAKGEDLKLALYQDRMETVLPAGVLRNGEPAMLNFAFLNGENGAHVNISGVSGVATKTSYALFLLYSIFNSQALGLERANSKALVFNVKGQDLLFLDQRNSKFETKEGKISSARNLKSDRYTACGLPSTPFQDVQFLAPPVSGEGGTVTFAPSPLLIHKQLSLMGSWVCSVGQMAELLERLARWELHPEVTITHRFGLEQAHEAYEVFDTGRTGKVAIVWD